MRLQTDAIGVTTLVLVILAWISFGAIFLLRKKPPVPVQETKRAPASFWGIFLQSLSFAFIWVLPRPHWWPFRASLIGEIALGAVCVLLAYASCIFCWQAIQTLGKQWTYQARVIEGHELIQQGPYAVVRNPIYLGMFGLILAAGLTFSNWWQIVGAMATFVVGLSIRIRAEEGLLRETFGSKFDEYARRVPAFLPRLF
jgi:protein-S-isoprenylcysteine O-methyltransferase Ste14